MSLNDQLISSLVLSGDIDRASSLEAEIGIDELETYLLLASNLFRLGRYKRSSTIAASAARQFPADERSLRIAVASYRKMGHHADAISLLSASALRSAWALQALCLLEMGRLTELWPLIADRMPQDPFAIEAWAVLYRLMDAEPHNMPFDISDQAEDILSSLSIEASSEAAILLFAKAKSLSIFGSTDRSREAYQRANALMKDHMEASPSFGRPTPDSVEQGRQEGRVVLLYGLPRSGLRVLGSVLSQYGSLRLKTHASFFGVSPQGPHDSSSGVIIIPVYDDQTLTRSILTSHEDIKLLHLRSSKSLGKSIFEAPLSLADYGYASAEAEIAEKLKHEEGAFDDLSVDRLCVVDIEDLIKSPDRHEKVRDFLDLGADTFVKRPVILPWMSAGKGHLAVEKISSGVRR